MKIEKTKEKISYRAENKGEALYFNQMYTKDCKNIRVIANDNNFTDKDGKYLINKIIFTK